MPTCAEARPGTCACCGAAALPIGQPIVIVGHGVVERQVLGPDTSSGSPIAAMIDVRRYRCRACKAILVVGPRGLVPRRRYGASAIGLALAVFARGGTGAAARVRTSPARVVGPSAVERWATLSRWIDASRRGELFGVVGIADLPRRRVAEHVVLALAARAGHVFGDDLERGAFEGAAIAA